MTLALLGIKDVPIGIKITIFDLNFKVETGIFLTVNPEFWRKDEKEKEGKKKKKYMVMTPLEENFDIAGFLKEVGFGIVYSALVIDKKSQNYEIVGKRMMKNMAICDNLENMLTVNAITSYLKKGNK